MNTSKLKTRQQGFTIVEVIFTLLVGIVIITILFLIIPQAQRVLRNRQRADDAARSLAEVQQFRATYNLFPNMMRTETYDDGTTSKDTFTIGYSDVCPGTPTLTASVRMSYYYVAEDPLWGHDAGPDHNLDGRQEYGANSSPCTPISAIRTPLVIPLDDHTIGPWRINTESFAIIFGETCNDAHNAADKLNPNAFTVFYVLEQPGTNGILRCID